MYDPINQIQSTNDEDEDQTEEELNVKDSAVKDSVQDSFLSYYSHTNFRQQQDLACLNAVSTPSNPSKISEIQEGFELASPKTKAKKRKVAAVDGGGRVVRAAGRKDKHSKVCTNRGPRDRRVRLSPTTAIQFYDVQDRLGYDRPSKAIDWLINEAKTAIDALDEQPSINFGDANATEHHGFSLSQGGMREKKEDLNNESLVSDFGSFLDEAPPPSAASLEAYLDQDSIFVRNKSEINLYPNWEMFTNCGNEDFGSLRGGDGGAQYFSGDSLPLHAAAQPISSHVNLFTQREPLQSSVINYSPINNDYFAGFNFSNDLSKIAASATAKQDQNSKKMSFTIPSATAHYQD